MSGARGLGLSILETEVTTLVTAMRRSNVAWSRSDHNANPSTLLAPFLTLKAKLNSSEFENFDDVDAAVFLTPFLDVIRSEAVTGHVTGLALDAVHKFLSYELLHPGTQDVASAVENMADSVTHARFVGMDPSSDEVVLMKILALLRLLMLSPVGLSLTNESVCEIMQSTFRICFEARLSDLLRKTAELALSDMIQLLFTRLPTFSGSGVMLMKKLKMRQNPGRKKSDEKRKKEKEKAKLKPSPNVATKPSSPKPPTSLSDSEKKMTSVTSNQLKSPTEAVAEERSPPPAVDSTRDFSVDADVLARSPMGSVSDLSVVSSDEKDSGDKDSGDKDSGDKDSVDKDSGDKDSVDKDSVAKDSNDKGDENKIDIKLVTPKGTEKTIEANEGKEANEDPPAKSGDQVTDNSESQFVAPSCHDEDQQKHFVNEQGVTFEKTEASGTADGGPVPYGLPCVRELFRFLISLINPNESPLGQGQPGSSPGVTTPLSITGDSSMIQVALGLLSTALETGACHLDQFESLLELAKDDLARNLIWLLGAFKQEGRLSIFSQTLWIFYLLVATQRKHLKYQLEVFLGRLVDIVSTDSVTAPSSQHKELVLETLVKIFKINGMMTELYFNYDCDLFTHNVFEDLIKMLSKNAFPITGMLHSTHFLSLDAILTIIRSVEKAIKAESAREIGSEMGSTEKEAERSNLKELKRRKNLIMTATEQFNSTKAGKAFTYLIENGLIDDGAERPNAIAKFIRENPHLDKKVIGDYISNRKNLDVLEAFVHSFDFGGLRVDESLRQFLESFRLPGEAPVITLILEKFAEHWQESNGNPFADADAAFTLAYAVIMLNVDQHNKNHTRTNEPMTVEQFTRNLRGTNGGGDHDPEMLADIYEAIAHEEIVMPAEQTGLVKENYIWKCVMKRSKEGTAGELKSPLVTFDQDLFGLVWGSAIAALSYVFDKSEFNSENAMIEKTLNGFQRCAAIASHYRMTDVIDNLIMSMAKFTTLQKSILNPYSFVPTFGMDTKAMLATRMVFSLAHKHGDFLRDGWKNLASILVQLFNCKLLPRGLMQAEDFVSGKVTLFTDEGAHSGTTPGSSSKQADSSSGFLNSFVYFLSISSDTNLKQRTPEEEEAAELALKCIENSDVEYLISESKFLVEESLQSLISHLIQASFESKEAENPNSDHIRGNVGSNDMQSLVNYSSVIFLQELLVRITIQNHDRVQTIWDQVVNHIQSNIKIAAKACKDSNQGQEEAVMLLERSVTSLLRMAIRLARKEDLAPAVVRSMKLLITMSTTQLFHVCRDVSFGMHEFLRNNAANVHDSEDWSVIFQIIEIVGAGASPGDGKAATEDSLEEDGEDKQHESGSEASSSSPSRALSKRPGSSSSWIVLDGSGSGTATTVSNAEQQYQAISEGLLVKFDPFGIAHNRAIVMYETRSFLKCCESMAFLIRDVAHITPHNFFHCVQALRTFVEAAFMARPLADASNASLHPSDKETAGSHQSRSVQKTPLNALRPSKPMRRIRSAPHKVGDAKNQESGFESDTSMSELSSGDFTSEYHHVALQLLDLMHTLHTRANQIHEEDEEEATGRSNLWKVAWCPLLQGMARLCTDKRSHIRTSALTTLQRALLFHDLQTLTSHEWEAAFTSVLFPMLSHLLTESMPGERTAMEETRTRAATLLGKIFLQHLTPLASLPTFTALWLTILDFMEKFIKSANSDLLADAVPESLKNMLLVMETAGIFSENHPLWELTWDKLEVFLPNLMTDLFGDKDKKATILSGAASTKEKSVPEERTAKIDAAHEAKSEPFPITEPPEKPVNIEESHKIDISHNVTENPAAETANDGSMTNNHQAVGMEIREGPALSPMDPPVQAPSFFASPTINNARPEMPEPTVINLPTLPNIGPMPEPPPGIQTNFQPIHIANPTLTGTPIPLATPKPVIPSQMPSFLPTSEPHSQPFLQQEGGDKVSQVAGTAQPS